MSTTKTFLGLSDEAKPSSRVLQPPGGGGSNIFGDCNEPSKTAKPYQKTSLFGSEAPAPQAGRRRGGPTGAAGAPFASDATAAPAPAHANSRGAAPQAPAPQTPAPQASAPAPEAAAAPAPAASNILAPTPAEAVNTKPAQAPADNNPLTGGSAPPPSKQIHTSTKVRQPPGGASSGPLW